MGIESVQGLEEDRGGSALPQVLTVEEVADLMRVDRKTAYAAIAEGGVPGVQRIGRCIRVSRDVLLRWLEQGEAKQARTAAAEKWRSANKQRQPSRHSRAAACSSSQRLTGGC